MATNNWYVEGVPFCLECVFETWTPETESMLMKIFAKNMDLLPGIKINKLYKQSINSDNLHYAEVSADIAKLREEISDKLEAFYNKYSIKEAEAEQKNVNMIRKVEEKIVKDYPSYLDYPIKESVKSEKTPEQKLAEVNYGYHELGNGDLTNMPNMGC